MSNIDYTKHKDSRKNNPTIENRNFFVAEENRPYDALYPRDHRRSGPWGGQGAGMLD